MKKCILILSCMALLLTGCKSEFNSVYVYKYGDNEAKYEFAKECFANGKFQQAISLLEELVTIKKGSDEAQECLYMLAMAQYNNQDYEAASETFKKYGSSYPRGTVSRTMSVLLNPVWISRLRMVLSQPISSSWISIPIPN